MCVLKWKYPYKKLTVEIYAKVTIVLGVVLVEERDTDTSDGVKHNPKGASGFSTAHARNGIEQGMVQCAVFVKGNIQSR